MTPNICVNIGWCHQQSTETVTPSTAKTASWLMPLLQGQELGETPTLMMMSSGRWETAKVTEKHYLSKTKAHCKSCLWFQSSRWILHIHVVVYPKRSCTHFDTDYTFDFQILCFDFLNFLWTFWHSIWQTSAIWKPNRKKKSLLHAFVFARIDPNSFMCFPLFISSCLNSSFVQE